MQDNAMTLSKMSLQQELGLSLMTHGISHPRSINLHSPCYYLQRHWKMEFMWATHVLWKKWKTIFIN